MKKIVVDRIRASEPDKENLKYLLSSISKEDDYRQAISEFCLRNKENEEICNYYRLAILNRIEWRFNSSKHLTILALVEPEKFVKTLDLQNKGLKVTYYGYSSYEKDYETLTLKPINPNYKKQLVEAMTKESSIRRKSESYLITLDVPYPGLISPRGQPQKVQGLVYEINYGNGVFHSSAEIYHEPFNKNMENFVNQIIDIIAQEILISIILDMKVRRDKIKFFKFLDYDNVRTPKDLAKVLKQLLDTSKGTKINNLAYQLITNYGLDQPTRTIKNTININIRPFVYYPKV